MYIFDKPPTDRKCGCAYLLVSEMKRNPVVWDEVLLCRSLV